MGGQEQDLQGLQQVLAAHGPMAIAFSGGVDSAFLLAVAQQVYGPRTLALTAVSPFIPQQELEEAQAFCRQRGIKQLLYTVPVLENAAIRRNDSQRCYYCKQAIFNGLLEMAQQQGLQQVAEGSNLDDLQDYRPGLKALQELKIYSPLREAGLTKAKIRQLSQYLGLPTWNKPSMACLASRFPYGEELTLAGLQRVDRAETLLWQLALEQLRVRSHGDLARIEVPPEAIPLILEHREELVNALEQLGFAYITLDLGGFKSGNMNKLL